MGLPDHSRETPTRAVWEPARPRQPLEGTPSQTTPFEATSPGGSIAPERLSDRHNLAWGHRLQSVQDGIYEWQQVFKLIGPGTDRNDRELPASEILLVRYALIYCQQDLVASDFGISQ